MPEGNFTKIDPEFADSEVIFRFTDCTTGRNYSFHCLNREQSGRFISRLRTLEDLTWSQLGARPRATGLTRELPGTDSFLMIDEQNGQEFKEVNDKYYFHFRVDQTGLFRVFGYQHKQFFFITHIDPNGEIHH